MTQYRIISQPGCKYCRMAKELLAARGSTYTEELLLHPEQKAAFKAQGFTTVPQIWHGDRHIGGYTELAAELG